MHSIEAALQAEQSLMHSHQEQGRVVELDLQQARYEAALAERRYLPVIPRID
jgi:hypothetical protein